MKEKKIYEKSAQRFEEIYRKYYEGLHTLATVITGSEAQAKDVVADVFFNLWKKAEPDFQAIKQIKAYLYTSVKNQALKSLAADPSKFNERDYDLKLTSIENIDPEELLIGKELENFLAKAIQDLPPQCGVVFQLFHEKGMSQEEISIELGISTETVRYHLKTALKKIRQKLENEFDNTRVINWYTSLVILMLLSI
ncbi:MAG: RNA polymerase sigma-70 factor [Cyclobacteriaceae bacterium]|nr:RNA polymerase sigma-70 factor [Cyclobacteriaceae bacterium SS2]